MSRVLGCFAVMAVALGAAGAARAQTIEAQGGGASVTVQAPPPPAPGTVYVAPGYGQQPQQQVYVQPQPQQQQVYVQPQYAQPQYVQPVQPPQPRYEDREENMPALWISGVVGLPVSYLLTAISATVTADSCFSTSDCRDPDYTLFAWVPLVGPFFMFAEDNTRALNAAEIAGAFFGALTQVGSVALIILGFALKQTVRVQTYSLDGSDRSPQLAIEPFGGPEGGGLGLRLTHF